MERTYVAPKNVESIFATSVLLSSQGRFKTEVHVVPNYIYLINADNTVIMEFNVPDIPKDLEFSFFPEDYESNHLLLQENTTKFITETSNWIRTKEVSVPSEEKRKVTVESFNSLWLESNGEHLDFNFNKKDLSLLEDRLSHIEIAAHEGKLILRQRDIYSGNSLVLTKTENPTLFKTTRPDFGPIAVRTGDFKALFHYHSNLTLSVYSNITLAWGNTVPVMRSILSHCHFNEMFETV